MDIHPRPKETVDETQGVESDSAYGIVARRDFVYPSVSLVHAWHWEGYLWARNMFVRHKSTGSGHKEGMASGIPR